MGRTVTILAIMSTQRKQLLVCCLSNKLHKNCHEIRYHDHWTKTTGSDTTALSWEETVTIHAIMSTQRKRLVACCLSNKLHKNCHDNRCNGCGYIHPSRAVHVPKRPTSQQTTRWYHCTLFHDDHGGTSSHGRHISQSLTRAFRVLEVFSRQSRSLPCTARKVVTASFLANCAESNSSSKRRARTISCVARPSQSFVRGTSPLSPSYS